MVEKHQSISATYDPWYLEFLGEMGQNLEGALPPKIKQTLAGTVATVKVRLVAFVKGLRLVIWVVCML